MRTVGTLLSRYLQTVVICMLAFGATAQVEHTRQITKSFKVNPKATIEVTNKYGTVHFSSWDKDSVRIEISVELKAKNTDKLEKLKADLDFEFKNTEYYVTSKTVFGAAKTRFGAELQGIVQPIGLGSNEVKIDYKVYFPKSNSIKIYNKFGDVYCDDVAGDVRIKLSHGDLKAAQFLGNAQVDVKFGKGHVNYAKSGRFTIEYSEFTLKKAGKISINSKTSTINIDQVEELKTNSRRDKFFIGKTSIITGESTFSDYQINEIDGEITLNATYGEMTLGSVPGSFKNILINSKYTDLFITFEEGSSYKFALTHRKVDFSYPLTLAKLETAASPTDDKVSNTTGMIGENQQSASRLEIVAEGSDVVLIHK